MPCREEFPDLLKARNEWAPRSASFYFVTLDGKDEVLEAKKFLKSMSADFKTYRQREVTEDFINAIDRKWSGAIPVTIIYDKSGNILHRFLRPVTYSDLHQKLEELARL